MKKKNKEVWKEGSYKFQGTPLKYMQTLAQNVLFDIYKEDKRQIKVSLDTLAGDISDEDLKFMREMRDAMVSLSPDIQEEADKAGSRARIREAMERCI